MNRRKFGETLYWLAPCVSSNDLDVNEVSLFMALDDMCPEAGFPLCRHTRELDWKQY